MGWGRMRVGVGVGKVRRQRREGGWGMDAGEMEVASQREGTEDKEGDEERERGISIIPPTQDSDPPMLNYTPRFPFF